MQRSYIQKIFITALLEILGVVAAFVCAYELRILRDWIPFIQLPQQYIQFSSLIPYILMGVGVWVIVFARGGLYRLPPHTPIVEELRKALTYSFFWFLTYIGFVYLTNGYLTHKDIPRLIIIYTYLIATVFSVLIRYTLWSIYTWMQKKSKIPPENILVISNDDEKFENTSTTQYTYHSSTNIENITALIREKKISKIISLVSHEDVREFFQLAKIYGIPLLYPKFSNILRTETSRETWINGIPMVELTAVSITAWGRIIKRTLDILGSSIALIVLSPVLIIVAIGVYLSDRSGPVIYRNQRIGQDGRTFDLYKFRYMYWRYSTKESYAIKDDALEFEEKLKEEKNTREGPLYKIKNDPRIMPFGRIIERLSIDELPQLYNVLIGDMSLVGPRPHQPREIALYDEVDKQVLTVKPGITGMAQVYGRDKNTFKEEVALDTYYIENYSLSLDLAIILRTLLVVIHRAFGGEKLEKQKK